MNVLFIHQNFPAQYLHICQQLLRQECHTIVSIGMGKSPFKNSQNYAHIQYSAERSSTRGIHPWVTDIETKSIRAEACGKVCQKLKSQGFVPDIICGHPGWGELLGIPYVWPQSPILMYQEFYYNEHGFDSDFDPEFAKQQSDWSKKTETHLKNANSLLNLQHATWNVTPTNFQRSSFPIQFHQRFSTIHDGVSNHAQPAPDKSNIKVQVGKQTILSDQDQLITFVNRRVEPYRGCHSFIRSIPLIQERNPNAIIVIVGIAKGVSYGSPCPQGEWKDVFLKEIEGHYDPEKVLFVGQLPYQDFLNLLKLSRVHVYLTYPFVLSWSLLEAMSTGCAIVGSSTAPVKEVIEDNVHGLLVNFFDPKAIAAGITDLLHDGDRAARLGKNAHQRAVEQYSLERCLPRQLELINLVARKVIGA